MKKSNRLFVKSQFIEQILFQICSSLLLLSTTKLLVCAQHEFTFQMLRPKPKYLKPNTQDKYKEIPIQDAIRAIYTPPRDYVPIHEPQEDAEDPNHPHYNFHYPNMNRPVMMSYLYPPNPYPATQSIQHQHQFLGNANIHSGSPVSYQHITGPNYYSNRVPSFSPYPFIHKGLIQEPPTAPPLYQTNRIPSNYEGGFKPSNFGKYYLNNYQNHYHVPSNKFTMKFYVSNSNVQHNIYDIAKTLSSYVNKRHVPSKYLILNTIQGKPKFFSSL